MVQMADDLKCILYSEEEINKTVASLAEKINSDYKDLEPVFIGILKGSFVFMADLIRKINLRCTVDFMAISSYGSAKTSSGKVKILKDLSANIEGKNVILVEDILDSGLTLSYLINYLQVGRPKSVKVCTLLDKPSGRKAQITADYSGIICPDEFIVGYGLDFSEKYRNLPYIGVLKPEAYA